ncbi:pyridoxamine 5'-phosphate oxidase [Kocuria dechangensis]|uniref:Pyridoxamine 5'-phosphate oxidase n=1 Tax=Kocuria dechangensis TaxID=1176249 RepID=A0A917H2E6_9MICC|nr:pyridoxamine 5'-phosphate oxidase family protein [Kocuria dechangensis]GGG65281.1 pyridoxamine 5'-phosphate oxidase [Kocuria dechangensis]
MTDEPAGHVEELSSSACWELLRTARVGRLAVWVDDHPDIFPVNHIVDHGTLVFRTAEGTKLAAALSETPVALEIDGYDEGAAKAWSVVVRGRAEQIQRPQELMDTMDLPLLPWQAGRKGILVRIVPELVTGRRFPIADPEVWRTPFSGVRRAPSE